MSFITLESHGRQVIDRVTDILKEVCGGYANQLPDQSSLRGQEYREKMQFIGSQVLKDLKSRVSKEYSDPELKEMADCVVGTYRLKCQTGKIFQDIRAM